MLAKNAVFRFVPAQMEVIGKKDQTAPYLMAHEEKLKP